MNIKTAGIIYTVLLLFFALSSIAVTWANDLPMVLAVEIATDLIIIVGVILAIGGLRHRVWIVFIALAAIGEIYLLATDNRAVTSDNILWGIVLAPAFYFNSLIVGLRSQIIKQQK
jgi:hypothetical protein